MTTTTTTSFSHNGAIIHISFWKTRRRLWLKNQKWIPRIWPWWHAPRTWTMFVLCKWSRHKSSSPMVNGQHPVNQKHALYLVLDGDSQAKSNYLDRAVLLPMHRRLARVCATFFRWFEKNKLVVDCLFIIHNISNQPLQHHPSSSLSSHRSTYLVITTTTTTTSIPFEMYIVKNTLCTVLKKDPTLLPVWFLSLSIFLADHSHNPSYPLFCTLPSSTLIIPCCINNVSICFIRQFYVFCQLVEG